MSKRILIVGAGVAGLALARAFERTGTHFDIIERASGPTTAGAGFFLPGNAAVALEALGLADPVRAVAHHCLRQTIFDSDGTQLIDMDIDAFWLGTGPCLSLTRGALSNILRGGVETPIRYGTDITSIADTPGPARVTFSTGETAEYDLVVGADGIGSTVRAFLFGNIQPHIFPRTCWRFLTPNNIGLKSWTLMLGPRRAFLGLPVEGERLYVYVDADNVLLDGRLTAPLQEHRTLFQDFARPLQPLLDGLDLIAPIFPSTLGEVPARNWVRENAILIGDAAHASSPAMASGASMAFEDALVLADSLTHTADMAEALAEFGRQRLERVLWVQKQCRSRDATRSLPRFARNTIVKLLGEKLYRKNYGPLLVPFDRPSSR